jgi:hypothetical protein
MRNLTSAYLMGYVAIDLKVISPYDGMLTINIGTLNFTRDTKLNFLDMNNLNASETSPQFLEGNSRNRQYFISKDVINSIKDNLLITVTVILKPNWISPNATAIGIDLGDLTFEAHLFAVRINQTIENENFTEHLFGTFTPTN